MKRAAQLKIVCVAVLVAMPWEGRAALITHTNLSSFQSAAGPTTLEDFNSASTGDLATPVSPVFSTGFGGFTLSGNGMGDYLAVAPGGTLGNIDGTPFLYFSSVGPFGGASGDGMVGPSFTFTFPTPQTAFGFDWTDHDQTDAYTVTILGSSFTSPPFNGAFFPASTSGFFGVTATGGTTFTAVTFTSTQQGGFVQQFGVDNIRFSQIPEPTTLAIWSIGIAGFAVVARRRRKTEAA